MGDLQGQSSKEKKKFLLEFVQLFLSWWGQLRVMPDPGSTGTSAILPEVAGVTGVRRK
jgi:hypothetical protein